MGLDMTWKASTHLDLWWCNHPRDRESTCQCYGSCQGYPGRAGRRRLAARLVRRAVLGHVLQQTGCHDEAL